MQYVIIIRKLRICSLVFGKKAFKWSCLLIQRQVPVKSPPFLLPFFFLFFELINQLIFRGSFANVVYVISFLKETSHANFLFCFDIQYKSQTVIKSIIANKLSCIYHRKFYDGFQNSSTFFFDFLFFYGKILLRFQLDVKAFFFFFKN